MLCRLKRAHSHRGGVALVLPHVGMLVGVVNSAPPSLSPCGLWPQSCAGIHPGCTHPLSATRLSACWRCGHAGGSLRVLVGMCHCTVVALTPLKARTHPLMVDLTPPPHTHPTDWAVDACCGLPGCNQFPHTSLLLLMHSSWSLTHRPLYQAITYHISSSLTTIL